MKKFYTVVYRDLKEDGYDNSYELITVNTNAKVIKEQIIKGQFGYSDMYIRHLPLTLANKIKVSIVSYTDYELTKSTVTAPSRSSDR